MQAISRYQIPAETYRVAEEINRSRFITTIGYAPTVNEARTFISQVSAEFADASHNCWAHVVGPPGATGQVGMSDAGEPHGTAGRPMLTVLLHSGVGDICAVVTRYFGGTLLGKGGLVKAYSGGVKLGLETLPMIEHVPCVMATVVMAYAAVTPFQRMVPVHEVEILTEEYAVDVTMMLKLPEERVPQFMAELMELTNGAALVDVQA